MLAQSGPAGKSTLSVFYQIWNTNDQNFNPAELSMALGAGLVANIFSPEECIANLTSTGILITTPDAIHRQKPCNPGNGPSYSGEKKVLKIWHGHSNLSQGKKSGRRKPEADFPDSFPIVKKMTKVSASMPEALLRPQAHHAETLHGIRRSMRRRLQRRGWIPAFQRSSRLPDWTAGALRLRMETPQ